MHRGPLGFSVTAGTAVGGAIADMPAHPSHVYQHRTPKSYCKSGRTSHKDVGAPIREASTEEVWRSRVARTPRRGAVALDDVTAAADLDGLWPRGSSGQVVVTTRLPQMDLASPDRKILGVSGFSRREGLGYLNSRLTGYPDQRIESLDLAEDVSGLPISLDQAAAVIMESDTTSREYRARYTERHRSTAGPVIDGCPQAMLATRSIAVERAHQLTPAGLAWPALSFGAMLATNGIPAAVLTAPAACAYITGRPSDAGGADQNLVRSAYANLARLGLISLDKASGVRTVWLHAAVQ